MPLFRYNKKTAETSVVPALAAVLPSNPKPWYQTRHLLLLNLMLLIPMLSSATIGFDGAMMNGLQTVAQWRVFFGTPNASILGIMNAIYPIGKIMGIFPATFLCDKYGRKSSMWVGLVMLVIGAGLQGGSTHLAMFIVSRWFLGAATALIAQPSPIMVSELAYPTHRGKVTALYQTFFYLGAIFAAWSTFGTFRLASTFSWRIPSLLQGAIPLVQFAFFYWVPESPRWLIANGRMEEAAAILAKWHAGGDRDSPLVRYELEEIENTVRLEKEVLSETSYLDLLRTPANRRRTLLAAIIGFFAQWVGNGVVSYYITLVLNTIGITATQDQALINGLLQIFNWFSAIFAGALMVDRLGRRTLFLASVAGMFVSYVCWTALTAFFTSTLNRQAGHGVVAFIFIFYFFYNIAWSPLLLAYPVEIFPFTLRARGVSVTYGATFIGLIIGMFVNPIAMSAIGWRYYIVFCCILFVLFFVIWFLLPETKGRTLEEIAEIFEKKGRQSTGRGENDMEGKLSEDHAELEEVTQTKA